MNAAATQRVAQKWTTDALCFPSRWQLSIVSGTLFPAAR
jgi:hypothetical protein